MRRLALLALSSLVLAGCVQAPDLQAASVDDLAAPLAGRIVAHDATGLLAVDDAFAALEVRLAPTGFRGGEPSIGVTSDGVLFTAVQGKEIARSMDHGKTWTIVTPPQTELLVAPKVSLDPWVYVDPLTDRVFNAPLYVVCTWMSYSDDKGASWKANPLAGCGIPAHDHQKLTTGAPAEGVKTEGYPSVIYYSHNSFRLEGTVVLASYDGGKTFTNERVVHQSSCHSGIAGPVVAAPDGTAYSAKPTCDGVNIAVSRDSGKSWEVTGKVEDVGAARALAHMVDTAVDASGNAYVTWTGKDGRAYITSSVDAGKTWSKAKLVSPPTVNATVYNVIAAGADGRVVVGYIGTPSDTKGWATKDAQSADEDTVWHMYLSYVDDAASDSPRVTTVQVTPDDDPVQRGCIWQSGGSNPCRNLGDFVDLVQLDGRPYLVYADGCAKCATAAESRRADVVVAIVEKGPSLVDGLLAPLVG